MKERVRQETDRPKVPVRSESSAVHFMLSCEKRLLSIRTPSITRQIPAGADDAVTWNQDRHRVGCASPCNGANGRGPSDRRRHLFICAGLAVGNSRQRVPDLPLKCGSLDVEREVEPWPAPLEMPYDLARPAFQAPMAGNEPCCREFLVERPFELRVRITHEDGADAFGRRRHQQSPERRVVDRVRDVCACAAAPICLWLHRELRRRVLIETA